MNAADALRSWAVTNPFDRGVFAIIILAGWMDTNDQISDLRYGTDIERRMFMLFVAEALRR